MSTMIEPSRPASPSHDASSSEKPPVMLPDGRPNVALLEDQLPDWLKASKHLAIFTAVLGLTFFSLNRLAIRHTDVWGHLSYGRWIAAHGELPQTEPLLELSQGVPWVDVAWLSKLSMLWTYKRFGIPGLQMLHATTLTIEVGAAPTFQLPHIHATSSGSAASSAARPAATSAFSWATKASTPPKRTSPRRRSTNATRSERP